MKYLNIQETAIKWNVPDYVVQRCCISQKIQGAIQSEGSWLIPENTMIPKEVYAYVRHKSLDLHYENLMPLLNAAFIPGECLKCIEKMPSGPAKDIAMAEYHYFIGQAKKTIQDVKPYLNDKDQAIQLSANLLFAYACLTTSEIQEVKKALSTIESFFQNQYIPSFRAAGSFIRRTASVLLHLTLPNEDPPLETFLPLLPEGLRAFAIYVQAHYLYLQCDYARSLGLVEGVFAMSEKIYPISFIYLHLVAAMDCMSLHKIDQAKKHLLDAWELAEKDDLIEGFGEHHGLLQGLLETVIKKDWPEDFKRIIAITYEFSSGWRKIHNPSTGSSVADNLTTTEFSVAMLASKGWTNDEIARHLDISINTVKSYMSVVYQKLAVHNRKELKEYMLK